MTDFAEQRGGTSAPLTLPLGYKAASGLIFVEPDGSSAHDQPNPVYLRSKRIFDIISATAAIIVLLPALLLVALLVGATSGGVFFSQERLGLHGKTFRLMKFRTMRLQDDDPSGVRQTVQNDPRVTWIGRFLRRYNLDELPQLLNVIRGDMSVVGPRPHVGGQLAAGRPYIELVPYYAQRLSMRPGLTGWAQANGLRGPTTDAQAAAARIAHDIAYIQNCGLLLDFRIILMTLKHETFNSSGY